MVFFIIFTIQSNLVIAKLGYNEDLFIINNEDFLLSQSNLSIWLTIANFIKKPGYNAYNEDLAEQHNVLLIDYNEDLHYKQTDLHYKKLYHHKFVTNR